MKDLVELLESDNKRLCELVDGVLVEKAMGWWESRLACILVRYLEAFVTEHKLGIVLGSDGAMRILKKQVRFPDVSFVSVANMPQAGISRTDRIPALVPTLAVEVLSESNTPKNTPKEMKRKLRDYFKAGTLLVWLVNPEREQVEVYTSVTKKHVLGRDETLHGREPLPGFELPLVKLFTREGKS